MNSEATFISHETPRIETHYGALATPTSAIWPSTNFAHGHICGCLYDHNGHILRISQRVGGTHGDYFPTNDPENLISTQYENAPTLTGSSIYLGHHMPHYGHFLVEMLSTFWCLSGSDQYDNYVFHPFAFGNTFPQYVLDAFDAFAIPRNKVLLILQPTRFEKIAIPQRLVTFHASANAYVRNVYFRLRKFYAADTRQSTVRFPRRVYISRAKTSLKTAGRIIANECALERKMQVLGFEILYPEDMTFRDQIQLFSNADVICGPGGSGMHNVLFMRNGTQLIEIGDGRSQYGFDPMQQICNQLAEVSAAFIPFEGRMLNKKRLLCWLDIDSTVSRIKHALASPTVFTPKSSRIHEGGYSNIRELQLVGKCVLKLGKWQFQSFCESLRSENR